MRTELIALAGATFIATLGLPIGAESAEAASCRSGSVCTWSKNDFGGKKRTSRINPSPGCSPWSGKTVSNQTKRKIRVYSGESCSGSYNDIKSGHWGQTKPGATITSIAVLGP